MQPDFCVQLHVRIDRVSGVVVFARSRYKSLQSSVVYSFALFDHYCRDSGEVLNEWAGDVTSLLGKLDRACQAIYKERMVHQRKVAV